MMRDGDDRKNKELFAVLCHAAAHAGIEIIEDRLNRTGGVCRLNGRVHVIFDERAPYREKNRLLLQGMAKIDFDAAYLPPKVREILASGASQKGGLAPLRDEE